MKQYILLLLGVVLTTIVNAQNTFVDSNGNTHYVVTSTIDPTNPFNPPTGTLRWAINQANSHTGLDYIDFNISNVPVPVEIIMNSYIYITDKIIIDGNTQPVFINNNEPKINISGQNIAANNYLFFLGLSASKSIIKNIEFHAMSSGTPLYVYKSNSNTFINNVFNCQCFVSVSGDSNVFYGNYFNSTRNQFNNPTFTNALNINPAILFTYVSITDLQGQRNIVGGILLSQKNYFYNLQSGVAINQLRMQNKISGNYYSKCLKNINLSPSSNNNKLPPVFTQATVYSGTATIAGTSVAGDTVEVYKSNAGGIDAVELLGYTKVNTNGTWSINATGLVVGDKIVAIATDVTNNTSEFTTAQTITVGSAPPCYKEYKLFATDSIHYAMSSAAGVPNIDLGKFCVGKNYMFVLGKKTITSTNNNTLNLNWDFGDGTTLNEVISVSSSQASPTIHNHKFTLPGTYNVIVTITGNSASPNCIPVSDTVTVTVLDCTPKPTCCSKPNVSVASLSTQNRIPQLIYSTVLGSGAGYGRDGDTIITYCQGERLLFTLDSCSNITAKWTFKDNDPQTADSVKTGYAITITAATIGAYNVSCSITGATCDTNKFSFTYKVRDCVPHNCTNCIGSFSPESGKYVLTAWTKQDGATPTTSNYTNPQIKIVLSNGSAIGLDSVLFVPSGEIIDGWQRVEGAFNIPTTAAYIKIELKSLIGDSYFDDIRIHPFDGSMKSYVYDPITLRLTAELDERNYATFYEYDEEGKLVRVKKETEKGIMTIKENKNSSPKRN
ncbi:MAG: PKD domain-containing protein [Bacteroidia bacterium]|nr:PKD domain-containing protein [Bacteroidia bacterium]